MSWSVLDLDDLMELISAGDNEKKAASAPEIRADSSRSNRIAIRAIKRSRVNGFMVKPDTALNAW
jgi:hypothetical protein